MNPDGVIPTFAMLVLQESGFFSLRKFNRPSVSRRGFFYVVFSLEKFNNCNKCSKIYLESYVVLPYVCFMKAKEKRKVRAYKATDKNYTKAMRQSKKCGVPLAVVIESFIHDFGDGLHKKYEINLSKKVRSECQ